MRSKESFKMGENILTRLESLDYAEFSKGLRIIERLYPIPIGKNPLNPLIYKGLRLVLFEVGRRKAKWYFESNKPQSIFINTVLSICYDFSQKVGLLKLLRVLTCKKFPCKYIACTMRS